MPASKDRSARKELFVQKNVYGFFCARFKELKRQHPDATDEDLEDQAHGETLQKINEIEAYRSKITADRAGPVEYEPRPGRGPGISRLGKMRLQKFEQFRDPVSKRIAGQWVFENMLNEDAHCDGDPTGDPQCAPSPGAWGLLIHCRSSESARMKFYDAYLRLTRQEMDRDEGYDDDGRDHIEFVEKLERQFKEIDSDGPQDSAVMAQ